MNEFYYIKNNRVFVLEEQLDPTNFKVGETWEDYLKGSYILLSEEQVSFYNDNLNASVEEVFNMKLRSVPERTLEDAKAEMLMKIAMYDNSSNVNSFTINNVIPAWFTPTERTDHALSIQSAKNLGQETLIFAVGDNVLQVPTNQAELMLSAIQLYANACYMITKQHQITVNQLDSIEEVDNYDYTTGYPEKLNFDLI